MFETIALALLDLTMQIGYVGIFITMFLVFTFVPVPSQIVLIPAGYLASKETLDVWMVVGAGTLGGIAGAHTNYWIAKYFGSDFIMKYGKYVFIKPEAIIKIERFLEVHGAFSITLAFITPGIGQLASLPAGLVNMNKKVFLISALIGSFIWNCMMIFSGFYFGEYQDWIFENIKLIFFLFFLASVVIAAIYFYFHYLKNGKKII